jgi:hypothetical protein
MPRFCIDTSSLVAAWLERYPIDNFPGFWASLEGRIASGDIVTSKEVLGELKRRDKGLHKWCKNQAGLFVEIDDACQIQVSQLMKKYPKFVDTRTGKNSADPFVIGLARAVTPRLTVITEEKGGSANRPAIPFVCGAESVPQQDVLFLIRTYGWKFVI